MNDDLALIYYAKGIYDQAIKMFETILEIEPTSVRLLNLGCYRADGQLSKAIEIYGRLCLEDNPENRRVSKITELKHYFLSCDGCGGPLQRLWHKCLTCFDYDLCDGCRKRNADLHSNHEFFTLPSLAVLTELHLDT
jgi:tetratricopeptide (TPR) repeat protein